MNDQQHIRIQKSLLLQLLILYALVLYFLVRPKLIGASRDLVYPVETIYYDSLKVDAVFLKKEVVFHRGNGMGISFTEGTRLPYGVFKAGRANDEGFFTEEKELRRIKDRLGVVDQEISDIDVELQREILLQKYADVKRLLDQYDYTTISPLSPSEITAMRARLSELEAKQTQQATVENFNPAGIISYNVDGMEGHSYEEFTGLTPEGLQRLLNQPAISPGDMYCKIIDNFRAMFIFQTTDPEKLAPWDNKRLKFSTDHFGAMYRGTVRLHPGYAQNNIASIEVTEHIEDFYPMRHTQFELILREEKALRIPASAITEQNGLSGVCVKDVSGVIAFRPVEVFGVENGYAYVSTGDENNRIEIGGERVSTLVFYEEVLIHPDLTKIDTIY